MASEWIKHVKAYSSKHKCSYGEAMKKAKGSYKKGSASKTHAGDMDFTTKRGNKDYHRGGHDEKEKRTPYRKKN